MKKLVFIDNDNIERAKEDSCNAKNALTLFGKMDDSIINEMELLPDFKAAYDSEKEKIKKLLFEDHCAIFSFSMYTANHYGSLQQLLNMLAFAGRNQISCRVYVDTTFGCMMQNALERNMDDHKFCFDIMQAIETNFIIGVDFEEEYFFRLRIQLTGKYNSPFKREPIDIKEYLK